MSKVRAAYRPYGLTFTRDFNGRIAKAYRVRAIPYVVIIGTNGRIAAKHIGYNESKLDALIDDINRVYRQARTPQGAGVPAD